MPFKINTSPQPTLEASGKPTAASMSKKASRIFIGSHFNDPPPPQLIDEPAGTQSCINSKSCIKRNTTLSQIIIVGADPFLAGKDEEANLLSEQLQK